MENKNQYKVELVEIDKVKVNLNNPRTIDKKKFNLLKKSIKDALWMLKIRPIVVDKDCVVLGGNMRFKACSELGLQFVWVMCVDDITDEQARRFIIRDNVDFGTWDMELLEKQYSQQGLLSYGAEIQLLVQKQLDLEDSPKLPPMFDEDDEEPEIDEKEFQDSQKSFNDNAIKQIVFQLPDDIYEDTLKSMDQISRDLDLNDNSEVLLSLINFYQVNNELDSADIHT